MVVDAVSMNYLAFQRVSRGLAFQGALPPQPTPRWASTDPHMRLEPRDEYLMHDD
jgi:hypothetical protein